MDFRRTSFVLCIFFIFHLQQNSPSVSSQSSPVDTKYNNETLPFNTSKPEVVRFEGKSPELAVVIKKGGGSRSSSRGGSRSSSRGGSRSSSRGGSRSRSRGGVVPVYRGSSGSHSSSGSSNFRGTVGVVGWLALSVVAGLYLVQ